MDDGTAFRLFEAGQPVSQIVDGEREDGVLITGLNLPNSMTLFLRTRVGEPDRRILVDMDKVELAPSPIASTPRLITPVISSDLAPSVADRSRPSTAEVGGSSPPRPTSLRRAFHNANRRSCPVAAFESETSYQPGRYAFKSTKASRSLISGRGSLPES